MRFPVFRTILGSRERPRFLIVALVLAGLSFVTTRALAQTAATGALNGTVTDSSGAVVPGASVTVTSSATGESRTIATENNGSYLVPLLPPGTYSVEATGKGFKTLQFHNISIHVTETATLNISLPLGTLSERVAVAAEATQLETTSSTLGNVTDEQMVDNLPLVTRNYLQILGLSPGVSSEVNNAASIGRGDVGLEYSTSGNVLNDNNFQMNGSQVNDLMGSGALSGGVPVPNPDSIQEFKVQTGQYDASYGRNAGANVDVVTKSGTNGFHGDVWEYFRNTDLNANDFFLKQTGQPRGVLNQNQFGGTLGGPVKKDKVFFFGSYQGTREKDGLSTGCLSGGPLPLGLTNDPSSRTAAALAAEFGIASPSDISPAALAVLNAKLANGQFLIPAPEDAATGTSTFSSPCPYTDNQAVGNVDAYQGQKSHLSAKFFFLDSNQTEAFPGNNIGLSTVTVPGFPQAIDNGFRDLSLTHTYTFSDHLLNQAVLAYHRTSGLLSQAYPSVSFANSAGCASSGAVTLASLCVPAPAFDNVLPQVLVQGSFNLGGNGQGAAIYQNAYDFDDSLTYVRGKHSLHFGGGIDRSQINFPDFHFVASLDYGSFNDFLTGNPLLSVDLPGLFGREWRVWVGDLFLEDDYKVLPRLTLNLGFRYERVGQIGEALGRASTFNIAAADPNPPAVGTYQGYVVASNFPGALPTGPDGSTPTRASTNTALNNLGQNGWEPRVGFAWQLPGTDRMVLRGGYGIFYTRTTGQPFLQLLTAPPYGILRENFGPTVDTAFPAFPPIPSFPAYSPGTALTPIIFSPNFQAPILQQYGMDLETSLSQNFMLDIGYHGARGSKLLEVRAFDQAADATVTPIRGQTTNTLANLPLREPIEGFSSSSATQIESAGASWYNALEVSVTKRFSHGLQFLASYTWTSALETDPGYVQGTLDGGVLQGDQTSRSNYGFDNFIRPQRFIVSYIYDFPGPKDHFSWAGRALGGWSVAGVATFQDGQRLTISETNSSNAFGISAFDQDRAELAPGCNAGDLVTQGSVEKRLGGFFNDSCFVAPPIIGADGLASGFGNSGIGNVVGPAQQDFDISLIKKTPLGHSDARNLEFRAEFYNAFNHPSFSNPVLDAGTFTCIQGFPPTSPSCTPVPGFSGPPTPFFQADPALGVISTTSLSPRIVQLALKLNF
jgi:Carboxypeptidase regulatory-like domain